MTAVDLEKQELYGGALTSSVPVNFKDASFFRQVPDTQEVFVSDDNEYLNHSMVFDIMEMVEGCKSTKDAAVIHLNEISSLNGVDGRCKILSIDETTVSNGDVSDDEAIILTAVEPSRKWGRTEPSNGVLLLVLGLIRITKVTADILISYNVPITDPDQLKDLQELVYKSNTEGHSPSSQSVLSDTTTPATSILDTINVARSRVGGAMASFVVNDWSLFG
ncbi:Mog1p [Sugiyamaella lignohabitans]|uniref:Mog1p n=1 Tax=Sugiyamaella lignohabitans TaxID=796027 RepID=A0A161HK26_9ASCO|nr:Mog1p [Sugiyamaella lignohabitans]ANB11908.1 Mog1p [Sugiyamaella lignohabitans]